MLFVLIFCTIAGAIGYKCKPARIAVAQTTPPEKKTRETRITADKIIADLANRQTDFLGNVRVTRHQTTITAERLRVYYRELKYGKNDTTINDAVQKISASGNVTITINSLTVLTEEATYSKESQVLTFSGGNSRVISGPHWITGSKFTLFRADGQLIVEGSSQNQIKAVFFPVEKDVFRQLP